MARPRTYTINEEYFNVIDTPAKAYILGFLYADGNIGNKNSCICTKLSAYDVEVLEFIKREVAYSGPIRNTVLNNRAYCTLAFNSDHMKQRLILYGITPNKTYNSKTLPRCPSEFYSTMLLGLFDGDGSIWRIKNKQGNILEYGVNFSGNDSTLLEIKEFLLSNGISTCNIRYRYSKSRKCSCSLDIKGSRNVEKLYTLLYSHHVFSLLRKRTIFEEFNAKIQTVHRNYDDGINRQVVMMYNEGLPQARVSDILHLPRSSVRTIVQRGRKIGNVTRKG